MLVCAIFAPSTHRLEAQWVRVDGSSTVFPIAEAVVEEFREVDPSVKVTIGVSGTGGGFKKFLAGEIDIVTASRPIRSSELQAAEKEGLAFIELPIAYDALSVVVNSRNTWAKTMTVNDLRRIWAPEAQGKVRSWRDVRAEWPDKPLVLFGAGVDSGTFDYFTEAIVGKEDSSRGDFTSSEDDNVIVKGVEGAEGALGFLGFAYVQANQGRIAAVAVDDEVEANGPGGQLPSRETVTSGQYSPLSRPLFIYVKGSAADRPEVTKFVDFFLTHVPELAEEVGYVRISESVGALVKERFSRHRTGSVYADGGLRVGGPLSELLRRP